MTSDNVTEVRKLLEALSEGTMSLGEVAQRFRERKWIRHRRPRYAGYEEKVAAELDDADPHLPGSFDDVSVAFREHLITSDQYRVLSEAAADAMEAQETAESDSQ